MANVSTLTVSLVADTAKFANGLKRARKQGKAFGTVVRRSMAGAAVGVAALTASLSFLVQQSFKVADQQKKMADRLGLTQRALAGLTLAGEQTGLSQRNLQLGLQRSTRRIAEAAQGSGEAVKALKELGVEAQSLSKLSPDEQFIRLAGAFKDVETQSDRVRLAFKLFDSEGVGLVNTLKLGEDGIRAFIKQVDDLGIALTDRQLTAIEDTNDSVNILKKSFSGLGNQIAAQLAPAITSAAEGITKIVARVTKAVPKFTAWAASIFGVKRALDSLTLADLTAEIQEIDEELFDAQNRLAESRAFFELNRGTSDPDEIPILKTREAAVEALTKRYNDAIRARLELKKAGESKGAETILGGGTVSTSNADKQLAATQARFDITRRELEKNFALFDQWESRANAAVNATRTPLEALQIKVADIRKQLIENPFFDADLAQRETQDAVDVYVSAMQKIKDEGDNAFGQIAEFQRQAFSNMQDILGDFLFEPFKEGLDGMLKNFADMLRKMVAQLAAQKLLTSFFGRFGLAVPGGGSSVSLAIGGQVRAGQTVTDVVGPNGIERFTPGASGSLRPLGMLNFTAETNINAGGSLSTAALVPILEANNKTLEARILNKLDRGAYS